MYETIQACIHLLHAIVATWENNQLAFQLILQAHASDSYDGPLTTHQCHACNSLWESNYPVILHLVVLGFEIAMYYLTRKSVYFEIISLACISPCFKVGCIFIFLSDTPVSLDLFFPFRKAPGKSLILYQINLSLPEVHTELWEYFYKNSISN